jgi:diguanylate cyclase (GGDEF)-like protein/PAS domain S-box-containing protein
MVERLPDKSRPRESGSDPPGLIALKLLLAALLPLAAAALQWHWWHYLSPAAWLLFFPAVFLASWLGGRACGLLATAVSAPLGWYCFVPPLLAPGKAPDAWIAAAVFAALGLLVTEFHCALRRASRALRNSRGQYARLFELAPDAAFIADLEGNLVDVNTACCRMLGLAREEMLGRKLTDLATSDDLAPLLQVLGLVRRDGKGRAECHFFHRNGNSLPCEISASILPDNTWQGLVRDISEHRRVESQLQHSAHHDSLTGLPNRLRFNQALQTSLDRARRREHKLALLYVDLDRFKQVNDTLGHEAGDQLLREIAQRLTACVRAADLVARLGGDEFTVVLEGIRRAEDAGEVAKKIIAAVRQPVLIDGNCAAVSASVGISIFPDDARSTQAMTQNADAALYRVKERGRDGFDLSPPLPADSVADITAAHRERNLSSGSATMGLCAGAPPAKRRAK